MDINIEWYMAARARIIYDSVSTLSAALLALEDPDLAQAVEDTFRLMYGDPDMTPLDAVEHQVARLMDEGAKLPVSNEEAYAAAKWVSQVGLANLPDPMPRAFVLYFASALHETGQAQSVDAALNTIISTKTFF